MEEERHKKEKKVAVTSAVALAAAASLVAGSLFDSPKDLLEGEGQSPDAIVMDAADLDGDGVDDDAGEDTSQGEEKRRGSPRSLLRARVLRLPLAVRLLVVLPLWGLGSLLLLGGEALLAALSPLLGKVLGGALLALVLIGAFLLGIKAVFPDLPWKKILNRGTVPRLLLAAALLTGLDLILSAAWADYGEWRSALASVAYLAVLTAALLAFARREQRRRRARTEPARGEEKWVLTDDRGSLTVPLRWPPKS